MHKLSKIEYINLIKDFEIVPFQQQEGWCNYNKNKNLVFLSNSESPTIALMATIVKLPLGFGTGLMINGFCIKKEEHIKDLESFLIDLKLSEFKFIEFILDIYNQPQLEYIFRISGFKKPIGQFNSNLTYEINLNELFINRNWKRNIKKSEGFIWEHIEKSNITNQLIEEISSLNRKHKTHKKEIHVYTEENLKNILDDNSFLLFTVRDKSELMAVRVINVKGENSFDVIAINNLQSIDNGASHFCIYNSLKYLQSIGIKNFDFSRIPVGKKSANGVTIFKMGISGNIKIYLGEWAFYKNIFLKWISYFYKKLILKKYEY